MAGKQHDLRVAIESTPKRAFATALDWPGWSRGGRTPDAALQALVASVPRYARVAGIAGLTFDASAPPQVGIEVAGSAHTDFGVPGAEFDLDREPLTPVEVERVITLVEAAWKAFDAAVASAPAELRKGPRGGGRDRDKIARHVLEAEGAYAGALGIKLASPDPADRAAVRSHRGQMVNALRDAASRPAPDPGSKPKRWTFRYATRRIAWHALDHAWEIEDRSTPDGSA